jgi:hypothetical protein
MGSPKVQDAEFKLESASDSISVMRAPFGLNIPMLGNLFRNILIKNRRKSADVVKGANWEHVGSPTSPRGLIVRPTIFTLFTLFTRSKTVPQILVRRHTLPADIGIGTAYTPL